MGGNQKKKKKLKTLRTKRELRNYPLELVEDVISNADVDEIVPYLADDILDDVDIDGGDTCSCCHYWTVRICWEGGRDRREVQRVARR